MRKLSINDYNRIKRFLEFINKEQDKKYSITNTWFEYIIKEKSEFFKIIEEDNDIKAVLNVMVNIYDKSSASILIIIKKNLTKLYFNMIFDELMKVLKANNINYIEVLLDERDYDLIELYKGKNFEYGLTSWVMNYNIKDILPTNNDLSLKKFRFDDEEINEYKNLYKEGFNREIDYEYIENIKRDNSVSLYSLWMGSVFLGALTSQIREDEDLVYLYDIIIRHKYRGRGYAKELIKKIMNKYKLDGYKLLELNVLDSNEGALSLYKDLGFYVSKKDYIYYKQIQL